MLRVCKNCNKEFEIELLPSGKYSRRQYCSRECEIDYNRKNKKKNKCKYCGKDINVYYADGSYAKTLEYCSDECREAALKEKYGYSICKKCGKKFERIRLPHGGYDERLYCPECTEKFNIRICINCGKEYNIKEVNGSKYCKECKEKLEHLNNYRICVDCGKEFKIPLSSTNSGRKSNTIYCPDCEALRYEKAHYGICVICGKRFKYPTTKGGYTSKSKVCSPECKEKLKGETNKLRTQTMLEKYGVTCGFLTDACIEARYNNTVSSLNKAFVSFLEESDIKTDIQTEYHIDRYYYDIYLPELKTLVEINPTISHTCIETGIYAPREKYYHMFKTRCAKEQGYRCINIWDWDDWNKIVQLIKPKEKLYARKLQLEEIDKQLANSFLNEYHLQKSCYGNVINLGLSLNGNLIQVMTFGKPRYNKNYQWELLRLCTKSNYIVIGGAEKLFKYFIRTYNPESIISYCDNSKFRGDVYLSLGFNEQWATNPSKIWSKDDKYITDNLLRQRGFDQLIGSKLNPPEIYGKGTDNEELMIAHKWLPIYDCGQQIFKWRK